MAHEIVTQTEIDSLLQNAGLPLSEPALDDRQTTPAPPFGTDGFELYEDHLDHRGYLRAPLTVASSLLDVPLL